MSLLSPRNLLLFQYKFLLLRLTIALCATFLDSTILAHSTFQIWSLDSFGTGRTRGIFFEKTRCFIWSSRFATCLRIRHHWDNIMLFQCFPTNNDLLHIILSLFPLGFRVPYHPPNASSRHQILSLKVPHILRKLRLVDNRFENTIFFVGCSHISRRFWQLYSIASRKGRSPNNFFKQLHS